MVATLLCGTAFFVVVFCGVKILMFDHLGKACENSVLIFVTADPALIQTCICCAEANPDGRAMSAFDFC